MRDSGLAELSIGHRCVALEQRQIRVRHLQAPGTLKIQRRACFVSQGEANHSAETPCDTCSPDTVKLENLHWPSAVRRSVKWTTPLGNSMPRHGAGGSGGAGFGGFGAAAFSASLSFAASARFWFPRRPIELTSTFGCQRRPTSRPTCSRYLPRRPRSTQAPKSTTPLLTYDISACIATNAANDSLLRTY